MEIISIEQMEGPSFARNCVITFISVFCFVLFTAKIWQQFPLDLYFPIKSKTRGIPQIYVCIYTYSHPYLFVCIYSFTEVIHVSMHIYIYIKPCVCIHILPACTYITIFSMFKRKTTFPFKGCINVTFVIPSSKSLDICLGDPVIL
jgi:hypothetical protein